MENNKNPTKKKHSSTSGWIPSNMDNRMYENQ